MNQFYERKIDLIIYKSISNNPNPLPIIITIKHVTRLLDATL